MASHLLSLEKYGVCLERGFLPSEDPLLSLPEYFEQWDETAKNLPKHLVNGNFREVLMRLPELDSSKLSGKQELERAMLLLSYFAHAWVWGNGNDVISTIPRAVSVPWCNVANALGRPPVLSYASHALNNWRRFDKTKGITLDNIARLQSFLGGMDEDWFVLVHIAIEGHAGGAIKGAVDIANAASTSNQPLLLKGLTGIAESMESIVTILKRMPERCDPYIFYKRVRPFIFGWNNPSLPDGVKYEGVDAKPQKYRGETGAQSSIIPTVDAALGISFNPESPLTKHSIELLDYMPVNHRLLINDMRSASTVRGTLLNLLKDDSEKSGVIPIVEKYNKCVELLHTMRSIHLNFAKTFIAKQAETGKTNPTYHGTGGTPFMTYLKEHCDETLQHMITI